MNARVVNPTSITAAENLRHKRQTSSDTFEEAILPMDDVYVQHRYDFFPGPKKRYEGIRSPLETPVIQLRGQRLSFYITDRDNV